MMFLNLYNYQAKASRCGKGLTYLKNGATTNQNQTLHSKKTEKKILKQKINGNYPTKKKKKEQKGNIKSTGKQGLKWN